MRHANDITDAIHTISGNNCHHMHMYRSMPICANDMDMHFIYNIPFWVDWLDRYGDDAHHAKNFGCYDSPNDVNVDEKLSWLFC